MQTPEFIRMTDRGPSFPSEYFAPSNKSAHYLTCISGNKYLTKQQMTYLKDAGVESKIIELED